MIGFKKEWFSYIFLMQIKCIFEAVVHDRETITAYTMLNYCKIYNKFNILTF